MSMFSHTLDDKPLIKDPNGKYMLDLTTSYFADNANTITSYSVKRISNYHEMRPDLVALAEYNDTDETETILKFTGISNPFILKSDDVMILPNRSEAHSRLRVNNPETNRDEQEKTEILIQNFYKYINTDYKKDFSSYYAIENMRIPSGVINEKDLPDYKVPYISEEGEAVTIKNGRLYFGENAGLRTTAQIDAAAMSTNSIDAAVRNIVNSTLSSLDSQCLYNGTPVTELQKANYTTE